MSTARTATTFEASAPVRFAKGALGVFFAWAAFSKRDGEDFYDSHGDHIPEDDLVAGALSLSQVRLLKVEHEGEARGDIPLVYPMTTDIAEALGVESSNSGLLIGFRPDEALAADIVAGEIEELSISGRAMAELVKAQIAKSAGAAGGKRKRKLTQVEIDEVSLVKRAAHGSGTRIAIAKRAGSDSPVEAEGDAKAAVLEAIRKSDPKPLAAVATLVTPPAREPIAKGAHPALTTATDGHSHLIYDADCEGGSTSYESMPSQASYSGHSHPWIRTAAGIVIGEAYGHTHDIATEITPMSKTADQTATATDETTKRVSVLKTALLAALAAPLDQRAYAARMTVDQAEAFFAKSDAERAAEVKDAVAHTSPSGEVFYKTDDPRLVAMAKRDEAREVEFSKAREAAELATFEKRAADELPNTAPTVRAKLLKAAEAIGPEAVEEIKRADGAFAYVTKAHGVDGGDGKTGAGPEAALTAGLADFAKSIGKPATDPAVMTEFVRTEKGAALYAAAYPAPTATH